MAVENISLRFRLKNVDQIRNYLIEEIDVSKTQKSLSNSKLY